MIESNAQPAALHSGPSEGSFVGRFDHFRREIDALLDTHIPSGRPVALLHFPYDGNVGNHMMWVATTDYLRDRNLPIAYVSHANNLEIRDLARVIGDGPILFLGGVTISRLWPRHARAKRQIAAAFPNNPLISLPATVLFADDADREEARTIFGTHENVTVMTRDPISGAQARDAFPPSVRVVTVPDMALRLAPQPIVHEPVHDVIWLARDDLEGVEGVPPSAVHVFDWPHDLRTHMPKSYALLRFSGVLSRLRSSAAGPVLARAVNPPMASLYRSASQAVLRYGNEILDRGKVLVTDRMHPHVLGALRGQHAVLLPDKFGKNRAVYDHYTREQPTVHWADKPAQALEIARSLVARRA
ncbi:MAG TPA: polysaccharide pyruvyl transferase family protein [Polyangiaceae bacterium]|nr:polysaccharide pyruvyl transferase family protein [Polyangiaceae bacterium]